MMSSSNSGLPAKATVQVTDPVTNENQKIEEEVSADGSRSIERMADDDPDKSAASHSILNNSNTSRETKKEAPPINHILFSPQRSNIVVLIRNLRGKPKVQVRKAKASRAKPPRKLTKKMKEKNAANGGKPPPRGGEGCWICHEDNDHQNMLLCEKCPSEFHLYCLNPPLETIPSGDWFCPKCSIKQTQTKSRNEQKSKKPPLVSKINPDSDEKWSSSEEEEAKSPKKKSSKKQSIPEKRRDANWIPPSGDSTKSSSSKQPLSNFPEESLLSPPVGTEEGRKVVQEYWTKNDRTCPLCNKELNTILEMAYHLKHQTCLLDKHKKISDKYKHNPRKPMRKLNPGEMYSTDYGIVEVVKDDRMGDDFGTISLTDEEMQSGLSYKKSRDRLKLSIAKVRRYLYKVSVVGKKAAGHPPLCGLDVLTRDLGPNPLEPPHVYADRIVECREIVDQRDRYDHNGELILSKSENISEEKDAIAYVEDFRRRLQNGEPLKETKYTGTILYLPRRAFHTQKRYFHHKPLYICNTCGGYFDVYFRLQQHQRNHCNELVTYHLATMKEREKVQQDESKRLEKLKPKPEKFDKSSTCYKSVYIALGFKKPQANIKRKVAEKNEQSKKKRVRSTLSISNAVYDDYNNGEDEEFEEAAPVQGKKNGRIRMPVHTVTDEPHAKTETQHMGYTGDISRFGNDIPSGIIDLSVISDEIHSGRYPSMKAHNGQWEVCCRLCRKHGPEELLRCTFCKFAEHLNCLKEEMNIRDPSPDDDFVCTKCVRTVLQRRFRAERRRLEGKAKAMERAGIKKQTVPSIYTEMEWSSRSGIPSGDWKSHVNTFEKCPTGGPGGLICCAACHASYTRLLTQTSIEMEGQTSASIGNEVQELIELLDEAKARLKRSVIVSKSNEYRRSLLESSEVANVECNYQQNGAV